MTTIYDNEKFFEAYAQMARSQKGLAGAGEWPMLAALMPDLTQADVLDLGCGYGWHCRYAIEHGAHRVIGIDQSGRMIARAEEINALAGITYQVTDLSSYVYPQAAFDLVLANLVLHYIADLDQIYRAVYETLKPQGVFLFNIEHPVFTAGVKQQWITENGQIRYWPVDDYFYPGPRTTDFLGYAVTKQHHTLTQILMGLIDQGFMLQAVEEVMPPENWRELMPEEMRRPMMLLVKAVKTEKNFKSNEDLK